MNAVAELEREPHHAHRGLGVVAVHVEDRRLHHLGDVGGVDARAPELGRGGEPELVVHDDVDGAADLVARDLGEVERLGDHALARERGVAVHEHRAAPCGAASSAAASPLARAMPSTTGSTASRWLGLAASVSAISRAVRRLVLAGRAEVVLHVAGALRARTGRARPRTRGRSARTTCRPRWRAR